MAEDAQHHQYGASGAEKWMTCAGALAMEQGQPDTYSPYADEGSAGHFLAAECLINGTNPEDYKGRTIVCWEKEGERDGQVFLDVDWPIDEGVSDDFI